MQIDCQQCRRRIPAEDLNIATGLARCRGCDSVFSLMRDYGLGDLAPATSGKPDVAESKRVSLAFEGPYFVLRRRWFSPTALGLLFFAILWNGFLVFWYAIAWGEGNLVMMLFPVLHVLAGITVGYSALAMLLNATVVRIGGDELSVTHGPLPWRGNRRLAAHEIEQLFVAEVVSHTKNGQASMAYDLRVQLRGGEELKMMGRIPDYAQARYVEQRIEEQLGIQDRPVPGEHRG